MTARSLNPLEHRTGILNERAQADPSFQVVELEETAQVSVRGGTSAAEALDLPTEPNTFVTQGDRTILWLGPDEWLVLAPGASLDAIVAEMDEALSASHRSVVDVSANRVLLRLHGSGVRDVLATGCPLDLHPRSWTAGRCAQSLVMDVPAILVRREEHTTWLLVRPSFAEHVVDRLLDAASVMVSS
ncbi:MAG: sarcosine oxidase subunit gamma family protein [Actinomycetota bacterium]